jgi:hypothetical protein
MTFEASSFSASPGSASAHPFSEFRAVSCLGSSAVAAVVVPGLFCGVLLDGVVRPTLGIKGLDRVCSTGLGEGAIIVGVVYVFSGRPAGPGQEAATRFSFAVLALDSAIQASVAATIAGWSLPCTLPHLELQAWRQWKRPQTSIDPALGMRWVNRCTFSHLEHDVRARLG